MTQENRELLIKDLSARIPYGVKVHISSPREKTYTLSSIYESEFIEEFKCKFKEDSQSWYINERIQPYLFPISSMTEEQKDDLYDNGILVDNHNEMIFHGFTRFRSVIKYIDWLNKHHFDYRGLIEKGLAINATNLNVY